MRYHFDKPEIYRITYGQTYKCNHPVYSKATLYLIKDKGLCVIQQRYNRVTKHTWWGEIDPWLIDELYLNGRFQEVFNTFADKPQNDIYPTITIRQIMWRLRMKPLKKECWETTFDHTPI